MPGRAAGTSGNFAVGGGYGGSPEGDGLTNGRSTIGISKSQPIGMIEQKYPVLFQEYSLHVGLGRSRPLAGWPRATCTCTPRRGAASASMVMDHRSTGPNGALGGAPGGVNSVD